MFNALSSMFNVQSLEHFCQFQPSHFLLVKFILDFRQALALFRQFLYREGAAAKGMDADEVISRLEGIRCGFKPTSCPDQLAKAIRQALNEG